LINDKERNRGRKETKELARLLSRQSVEKRREEKSKWGQYGALHCCYPFVHMESTMIMYAPCLVAFADSIRKE